MRNYVGSVVGVFFVAAPLTPVEEALHEVVRTAP